MNYNKTKYGVNSIDQMCQRINTEREIKHWVLLIFYNMI